MPSTPGGRLDRRTFLRISGMAGAGLGAALLAACRPGKPAAEPTPTAGAGLTPLPSATATPKGGTVKWAEFYSTLTAAQERAWGIDARANRVWLAGVAKQFEQENRGWQVEIEAIPLDKMDQRLAIDANGRVSHDLVFVTPQLLARHRKLGDLLDLTPFVTRLPLAQRDDLSWSAVWQAAAPDHDQQFAVPVGLQAHALVYNRSRFAEAGLDPDRPPQTLDELLAAGQKLTRPGKAWGLGLYLGAGRALVEQTYAPLVWHFGGNIYSEASGAATLADEANQRAMRWLIDLVRKYQVVPPAAYAAQVTPEAALPAAFAGGQVAQAMGFGSYWVGVLQHDGLVNGCSPANKSCRADPANVALLPTAGRAGFVGGRCLAIHSRSQNPDAAWALLQTALRPANLQAYPDAGLPAHLSAWKAPEYDAPFYQTWLAALRNGRPMPATPFYDELVEAISGALGRILDQKADVAATLKQTEDDWNRRYSRV